MAVNYCPGIAPMAPVIVKGVGTVAVPLPPSISDEYDGSDDDEDTFIRPVSKSQLRGHVVQQQPRKGGGRNSVVSASPALKVVQGKPANTKEGGQHPHPHQHQHRGVRPGIA